MGDREAFLRMMGITDDDITHPDTKPSRSTALGGSTSTHRFASSHHSSSATMGGSRSTEGSGPLNIDPSPFRTASAALAGAQRDVVRMVQEEEEEEASRGSQTRSYAGGGYGDSSDSRVLHPKPTSKPRVSRVLPGQTGTERRDEGERHHCPEISGKTGPRSAILSAFGSGSDRRKEEAAEAAFLQANHPTAEANQADSAETCKENGNDAFERGSFLEAIKRYGQGIDLLEHSDRMEAKLRSGGVPSAALDLHHISGSATHKVLLAALYSNRSAAYLQASKLLESVETAYDHSLFDADQAVSLRPEWFKGYARQGDAYFKMGKYHQAVESYAMALSLDPGNKKIAESLQETRERAKAGSREEWRSRRARRQQSRGGHDSLPNSSSSVNLQSSLRSHHTPHPTSFNHTSASSPSSLSGEYSKGAWESLKSEMELTNHAPTGERYRQQQLEKFRLQRERGGADDSGTSLDSTLRRSFYKEDGMDSRLNPCPSSSLGGSENSLPPISKINSASSGTGLIGSLSSSNPIPSEYSTAAAAAYQQKLLDNYRRKRGI